MIDDPVLEGVGIFANADVEDTKRQSDKDPGIRAGPLIDEISQFEYVKVQRPLRMVNSPRPGGIEVRPMTVFKNRIRAKAFFTPGTQPPG